MVMQKLSSLWELVNTRIADRGASESSAPLCAAAARLSATHGLSALSPHRCDR